MTNASQLPSSTRVTDLHDWMRHPVMEFSFLLLQFSYFIFFIFLFFWLLVMDQWTLMEGHPSRCSVFTFKSRLTDSLSVFTFAAIADLKRNLINLSSSQLYLSCHSHLSSSPFSPSPFLKWVVSLYPILFCSHNSIKEMKSMKGRFLRKLKSIPTITTLKQGLVLQLNNPSQTPSNRNCHLQAVYREQDHKINYLGVHEQVREQKDEEMEFEVSLYNEESITSSIDANSILTGKSILRPPAISSEMIMEEKNVAEETMEENQNYPSLTDFEEKCPPGGEDSIIFYTTSLRSIRKTFEDCNSIRFLLESFRVSFQERDVSMDLEFREELWRILGGRVIPPRLFIKGRYIGRADEVVGLHEQGKLKKLLEGIPSDLSGGPCSGCANLRFLVCSNCNGRRKVFADGEGDELFIRCPDCNENGLAKCPICS